MQEGYFAIFRGGSGKEKDLPDVSFRAHLDVFWRLPAHMEDNDQSWTARKALFITAIDNPEWEEQHTAKTLRAGVTVTVGSDREDQVDECITPFWRVVVFSSTKIAGKLETFDQSSYQTVQQL